MTVKSEENDFAGPIMFGMLCLMIGVVTDFCLRHSHFSLVRSLPYTVVLFFIGVIIGVFIFHAHENTPSFLTVSEFSANLIVYGFLPILLFHEAMTMNRHELYQFFIPAVFFAGIGAFVVCILFAFCSETLFPHWSIPSLFLFASIMCATDPVSVVALLKTSKASSKLTMTIAGESILNDGAAMILYIFFFNMLNGTVYTASTFVAFICEMLIVSPLLGVLFGAVTAYLMRMIKRPHNDFLDLQALLTIACSYLSFAVAGYFCHVSGVLACAVAGVTVSYLGPIRILDHHDFHHTWEKAEWACNTLIFLFAGFIGGGKVASVITMHRIGYLFVLYFYLILTRAAMITVCLPILRAMGYDYTIQEAAFMTYAGLRGALGIALALEGAHNAIHRGEQGFGDELFFYVTGLASLTLLFNSPTAKTVLLQLRLIPDPNKPMSKELQEVHFILRNYMATMLRDEMRGLSANNHTMTTTASCGNVHYDDIEDGIAAEGESDGFSLQLVDRDKLHRLCHYYSLDSNGSSENSVDGMHNHRPMLNSTSHNIAGTIPSRGHHARDTRVRGRSNSSEKQTQRKPSPSPSSHSGDASVIRDDNGTHSGTRSRTGSGVSSDTHSQHPHQPDRPLSSSTSSTTHHSGGSGHANTSTSDQIDSVDTDNMSKDLMAFIRNTFLDIVRARYHYAIKHEQMGNGSTAAKLLLHALDLSLDDTGLYLSDWDKVVSALELDRYMIRACRFADYVMFAITKDPDTFHYCINHYNSYCQRVAMFAVTNFIDAHSYAQRQMSAILGKQHEQHYGALNQVYLAQAKVIRESQHQVAKAKRRLASFPREVLVDWYTHRAAKMIIQKQFQLLYEIMEQGVLSDTEAALIKQALKDDELRIKHSNAKAHKLWFLTSVRNRIVRSLSNLPDLNIFDGPSREPSSAADAQVVNEKKECDVIISESQGSNKMEATSEKNDPANIISDEVV